MSTERIQARLKPCGCGCKGSDHWHRQVYSRVVRDMRPASGTAETCWTSEPTSYQAEGWANFPWGRTRVVKLADAPRWWVVDRQSMLDAQNRRIERSA